MDTSVIHAANILVTFKPPKWEIMLLNFSYSTYSKYLMMDKIPSLNIVILKAMGFLLFLCWMTCLSVSMLQVRNLLVVQAPQDRSPAPIQLCRAQLWSLVWQPAPLAACPIQIMGWGDRLRQAAPVTSYFHLKLQQAFHLEVSCLIHTQVSVFLCFERNALSEISSCIRLLIN